MSHATNPIKDPSWGSSAEDVRVVDAVVVGAGMGGMYAVKRLVGEGRTVIAFEGAPDVGGVWLHNRYPGARVDIEAYYYCYFDPELYGTWRWTERYPAQPEILAYLRHYADHHDIRRHFRFSTWVEQMLWDPEEELWRIRTSTGQSVAARHVLMATGQLSKSRELPFPGSEDFTGEWVETSHWPDRPVEIAGKRVAVIGTGSSGVQVITEVAKEAASLHVFQRTPNYVVPSQNAPIDHEKYADIAARLPEVWQQVQGSSTAYLAPTSDTPATELSPEEQLKRLESQWEFGGLAMTFAFPDQRTDWTVNDIVSNYVREKIRSSISDPELAAVLEPKDYPIGTRRLCVCNGYYETYNRPNVELVNLREEPIERITPTGIRTSSGEYEFDLIISALGFDAFTGPIDAIDIRNEHGARPTESWQRGPHSYLGLMLHGFPNLYLLTGPGSPSVLVNFNVHNVYHVDVVTDLIGYMERNGLTSVQPTLAAQEDWKQRSQAVADGLIRKQVENYMTHVNEDGTRFFIPYAGGWGNYVQIVDDVVARGYEGFEFR
ncbi:flavin-containing monooxygenase [Mycolicibacterium smegmatis]|uniref:flavin-containing monooxygenase n=1 Tax=Mycolicibacterium smegmatis TaxID=1772 RepID=UPI0005DA4442|nr:NAD(P)/FAD-dependent oxidoreductase [Mycolicibacterium smegmatis]MDF1900794.1 NAD(P)/FAD-dependent oxidoreductase [Mycolicibacterium smegmatis]MDF1907073.1 NAD(P)/FAD-dependent oxidoreductase [Mycolicibacterium smegmatis]MDF1919268.1 NAD(P)/FAD-dependent oxidoreductase [Mycolicibacterium smegmatis]MDF1925335.1 NAD(P)/FAD-dependent oxidoreductase [Mycolicibacterium smegmatis]UAK52878.1 NAD(P)/FAD-dependent oxidoreductase [Mycolicibacterium smegmatis]